MQPCPHCETRNPKDARFCAGCGAELLRECSGCHRRLPPDARFCPHCGTLVMTTPPSPWWEKYLSTGVRRGLTDASRGIGVALLLMAAITAVFTPPWQVFGELLLLAAGVSLLLLANYLNSGGKPKPPGGNRPLPDDMPPGGLELNLPQEVVELDALRKQDQQSPAPPSSGPTQGPYLN